MIALHISQPQAISLRAGSSFVTRTGNKLLWSSTLTTSQISAELRCRAVCSASTALFFESAKDFRQELLFETTIFFNLISIWVEKKTGITGQITPLVFRCIWGGNSMGSSCSWDKYRDEWYFKILQRLQELVNIRNQVQSETYCFVYATRNILENIMDTNFCMKVFQIWKKRYWF